MQAPKKQRATIFGDFGHNQNLAYRREYAGRYHRIISGISHDLE